MMQTNEEAMTSISDKLTERRDYWMSKIDEMSKYLEKIDSVVDLESQIYPLRQEAVENFHNLSASLAKISKEYKEKTSALYKEIRLQKVAPGSTSYMFPTEAAIKEQIETTYSFDKWLIDVMSNHIAYLDNTIKTIDGIIYGISNRIKLEELKLGRS